MLRIAFKIMKMCVHTPDFDADLFRLFGPFADLHPSVEDLFQLLADYAAGSAKAQFHVDKLDSETRVVRLISTYEGTSNFLLVPFLEGEQTIDLLRAHSIELSKVAVA